MHVEIHSSECVSFAAVCLFKDIFKKPFYYLPTVNTGEWAMRQAIEGKMASDLFDIFQ